EPYRLSMKPCSISDDSEVEPDLRAGRLARRRLALPCVRQRNPAAVGRSSAEPSSLEIKGWLAAGSPYHHQPTRRGHQANLDRIYRDVFKICPERSHPGYGPLLPLCYRNGG